VLLALASAFSFGIGIVLLATASLESPVYSTLFLRISSAITAGVVLLARRTKARFSGIDVGIVGVLGVVDAVGYLGFTYAAATGQIALAAVLSGLYPVVTAVLAFFVHKERLTLAQILGVAVTLAGVVLISL
jgi:drug/metabolite transporter (DMT)-like permease